MSVVVTRLTTDQARIARDEALHSIEAAGGLELLRTRARHYATSTAEQGLLDELDDLNYLLGF